MKRQKTTVYLDPGLLRDAKSEPARTGRRGSEVFEDPLRSYLGLRVAERGWARSDVSEEEALELAYQELHEART